MRRVLLVVFVVVLIVSFAEARLRTNPISVTTTSQVYQLPRISSSVGLCSEGTDLTYFELWTDLDVADGTVAAATSSSAKLPAGTAAAPYCKSYTHNIQREGGAGYAQVTIIADSGTATVNVESK